MHEILEQGYSKEILAKLATQLDGMSYDELRDYIERREGTRRNFEATFNKSLLDVLIHAPFDFRTVDGVNRIVRSDSSPGVVPAGDGLAMSHHMAPGVKPAALLDVVTEKQTEHVMMAVPPAQDPDDVIRAAMRAVLVGEKEILKDDWRPATLERVKAQGLDLEPAFFAKKFEKGAFGMLIEGDVALADPNTASTNPKYVVNI